MGDYRKPEIPISKETLDEFSKAFKKRMPMEDKSQDIENKAKIEALKKLQGQYK